MTEFLIEGPKSAVEEIHRGLISLQDESLKIDAPPEQKPFDASDRAPLGMEPLTYLVIVFVGHVAGGITHDALKEKLGPAFSKQIQKITIRNNKE